MTQVVQLLIWTFNVRLSQLSPSQFIGYKFRKEGMLLNLPNLIITVISVRVARNNLNQVQRAQEYQGSTLDSIYVIR